MTFARRARSACGMTTLIDAAPGHGIGLAVVRDIAYSYGGAVSIDTSLLGGASIRVVIPQAANP